jgi:tripartite-type tricarboxylate transporter receptor subunit TctC
MKRFALAAFVCVAACVGAVAQEDFFRGKQVFLRVGSSAGSGYDLAARLTGQHWGKHIPGNPQVVVQNVPGAGGLQLMNALYNVAPKDGTVLGLVTNGMPTAPLFMPDQARFDISKYQWIGSNSAEAQIIMLWHKAPTLKIEDFTKVETIVGTTTTGVAIYDMPMVLNALMGTKFKIVAGYEGTAQIDLATERGEVHGQVGIGWISAKTRNVAQIKEGKLVVVAQFGARKHPDLEHVPLYPLPEDPIARQAMQLMFARQEYGRPILAPPGTPTERIAVLRKAYLEMCKDPEFRKEAERAGLEINPIPGEDLEALTAQVMKTSPEAVAKLRAILAP